MLILCDTYLQLCTMNRNTLKAIPGYRQIEYIIILNPHDSLQQKITNIRHYVHAHYATPAPLYGRPNIRLAKFFSWEMTEEKLISHLKKIAMAMPPFKVALKDYGSYPSHTLFINAASKISLQMAVKELRSVTGLIKSPHQKPHFISEFYIPIAVKLTPGQYEKAWLEFSNRQFTGGFIADSMLLLKKREGERNYEIAARLELMNLPVSVKQGALF